MAVQQLQRFSEPELVADSRAAFNACANLGDTDRFLKLFEEMPESGAESDVLTYNVMIKLCARVRRKDLLVFVLERILEQDIMMRSYYAIFRCLISLLF